MATTDVDVLYTALEWAKTKSKVVLATVVQTWGSAPRKAGSHMAIREDGIFVGSVSGGCVEGEVIQRAIDGFDGVGVLLDFGVTTEDAWEVGLSCGGEIQIWLEYVQVSILQELCSKIDQRIPCAIRLSLRTVEPMLVIEGTTEGTHKSIIDAQNDQVAIRAYYPSRRLFVVGAVHIAQTLTVMAQQVGYEVFVIDPRSIFLEKERWGDIERIDAYPEEVFEKWTLGCQDAVVALSHDPKIDDEALEIALGSDAFYIGALGSRKNHAARCQRLIDVGCNEEDVRTRIHGPVGLNIAAKTPSEIAVSILAQMILCQGNL